MRIRNLSNVSIDRKLLWALAKPFELAGKLPQALVDDVGLYAGQSLRVTVRPRLRRPKSHPSGTYTTGHIMLYPCPSCSAAFLTAIYLHELFHAWVSEVDQRLYIRKAHCHLADRFSDVAFKLLGGTCARTERCSTYRLRGNERELGMARYALYVASLSGRRGQAIMRWRGNMSVGKANYRLKLAARGTLALDKNRPRSHAAA